MKGQVDLFEFDARRHGVKDLRPFLVAVEQAERWSIARHLLTNVLAVLGGICWVMAALPDAFGARLRAFSLGLWAVSFALFLTAIVSTRVWRRRCARFQVARIAADDLGQDVHVDDG